jgi:hypothetical protein
LVSNLLLICAFKIVFTAKLQLNFRTIQATATGCHKLRQLLSVEMQGRSNQTSMEAEIGVLSYFSGSYNLWLQRGAAEQCRMKV